MSAASDVGTNYLEFFGQLNTKGQEFAANTRNRLRASYIAAKNYGKFQDWTESNNDAFAIIDHMVIGLTRDAGFSEVPQPAIISLANVPADLFEAEAARRGMKLSWLPPTAPPPPQRPKAPGLLETLAGGTPATTTVDLEDDINKVVAERRKG